MRQISVRPAAILVALSCLFFVRSAPAQLSEIQISKYVPTDAVFALTLNTELIRSRLDVNTKDHQYLIKRVLESSALDLTKLNRVVLTLGYDVAHSLQRGFSVIQAFSIDMTLSESWDEAKVLEKMFEGLAFSKEEHMGKEFHSGTSDHEPPPSVYFDDEKRMVLAHSVRLKKMLEEHDDAGSMMLVNQMDSEAELAIAFDISRLDDEQKAKFRQILVDSMILSDEITENIDGVQAMELTVKSTDSTPLVAILRCDGDQTAKQLKAKIETGLAAAPALIDSAEESLDDVDKEMRDVSRKMLDISRRAVAGTSISQNGPVLEIKIKHTGGLPDAPELLSGMLVAQFRFFDLVMADLSGDEQVDD